MSTPQHTEGTVGHFDAGQGTLITYITGFIASIVLTLVAYTLVVKHVFTGWGLVFILIGLAIVQLIVQLVFFLHLGRESKPRWNFIVFVFMLVFLFIIAGGSLWIMDNLNERMMTPSQSNKYVQDEEGIHL